MKVIKYKNFFFQFKYNMKKNYSLFQEQIKDLHQPNLLIINKKCISSGILT